MWLTGACDLAWLFLHPGFFVQLSNLHMLEIIGYQYHFAESFANKCIYYALHGQNQIVKYTYVLLYTCKVVVFAQYTV